jgi:hypothetical protein
MLQHIHAFFVKLVATLHNLKQLLVQIVNLANIHQVLVWHPMYALHVQVENTAEKPFLHVYHAVLELIAHNPEHVPVQIVKLANIPRDQVEVHAQCVLLVKWVQIIGLEDTVLIFVLIVLLVHIVVDLVYLLFLHL